MRRASISLLTALLMATGAVAYAQLSGGGGGSDAAKVSSRLHVSGHVTGLYPGVTRRMRVTVRNHYPFRVKVLTLRAHVSEAAAGCPARDLVVFGRALLSDSGDHHLRIQAMGGQRTSLRVRMRRMAPDACQGARFPLRFRARATR